VFAFGAGKRLGHHFAHQHLTGLAGMNVAGELVRRGERPIQQAEGACVYSASRRLKGWLPNFQSMSVGRSPRPFSHPDWFFEIKWDGFRSLAYLEHGYCASWSRATEMSSSPSQL